MMIDVIKSTITSKNDYKKAHMRNGNLSTICDVVAAIKTINSERTKANYK